MSENVSKEEAEKKIIEYLKVNKKAYPSDISDALQIEFDLVLQAIRELMKEGRLR